MHQRLAPGLLLVVTAGTAASCGPGETTEDPPQSRQVPLDGQPNFRDLGGYRTADGRTIKWGQVFRSGELPRLSDADVARVEELDLDLVISFLTEGEIDFRGRDRLPAGVREVSLPIDADGGLAGLVVEARKTGDFSAVPVELNARIHELLPDEGRTQYAALLRAMIDPANERVAFHCSHGVHRTGTASAILLWALGVDWETIRADYLLSNELRAEDIEPRLEQLRQLAAKTQGIEPDEVDTTNMQAFYRLQGSYIDATRDWILAGFGSIDGYLSEGLGLTDDEVGQLRAKLLD